MRFSKVQSNFSSGEFGPRLKGRTDLNIYDQGLDEMFNFLPSKEGPAIRRPGSTYMGLIQHIGAIWGTVVVPSASIDSGADTFTLTAHGYVTGDKVRLTTSNTLPSPLLTGTDYYVINISTSVFKLAASLADAISSTAINLSSSGVGNQTVTLQNKDIEDVHLIPFQISSEEAYIMAIIQTGHNYSTVGGRVTVQMYNYSPAVFSPLITTSSQVLYSSRFGTIAGNILNYGSNIHDFEYCQYGDQLILTHKQGQIPPLLLLYRNSFLSVMYLYPSATASYGTFVSDLSSSEASALEFPYLSSILKRAYLDINSSLTSVVAGGAVALGATTTITSSTNIFSSGMVGSFFKLTVSSVTYVVRFDSFNAANQMGVTYITGPGTLTTTATTLWEMQAWNDSYGHPTTCSFFEQRLVLGGTTDQPDTIWFSLTGNPYIFMANKLAQDLTTDTSGINFFGAVSSNDPFSLTLASSQINKINWLSSSRNLYAGSAGAENVISGGSQALAYNNFQIRAESNIGSKYVQPLNVDNSVIFVSRDGKQLRQLLYNDKYAGAVAKDLTLQFQGIHENLIDFPKKSSIVQMTYSQSRSTVVLLIQDDSRTEYALIMVAIDSVSDILGASKHQLAGTNMVYSIASLPNADTFNYDIIMAVKRGTDFTLESIHDDFDLADLQDNEGTTYPTNLAFVPVYLDCGRVSEGGVASTSINHPVLKSINVDVLGDGVLYEDIALDSSGTGTLPTAVERAIVGLPYTSRIKLLPLNEGGAGDAAGIIQKKTVDSIWVKYRNSKHFVYGADENGTLYTGEVDTSLTNTSLYSDIKRLSFNHSSDFEGKIVISTDKAFPLQILQVGYRGKSEEV